MTSWIKMSPEQRWDTVESNIKRMFRTGAQFVIGAVAGISDAGPVNALDLDWQLVAGSFAGGCVVWLVTTLAAPPKE